MKVRLDFNDMDKRIAECLIGTKLEGGWCLRSIDKIKSAFKQTEKSE